MTEQEIKDGSILIAKFLGWKQGFLFEWTCPFEPSKNGFRNIYAPNGNGMKFHTDWNWLIAGAKKFDGIHDQIAEEHIADYVCMCDEQDDSVTCYDIMNAFEVLVNNVKWYNSIV